MYIALAILGLGMLVVVHEAGHYFVARWSGMRVERFSIGFGPGIIKWRSRGTLFQIAPIPFGGFVQIVGMNPHEEFDPEDPSVYPNRPTILRVLTIFAGPFTNIIFASILVFIVAMGAGWGSQPTGRTEVGMVTDGQPAAEHLKAGDILTAIDGAPVTPTQVRERVIASEGRPLIFTFEREGKTHTATITPKLTEGVYRIGLGPVPEVLRRDIGVGEAAVVAVTYPYETSGFILGSLWDIVTGKEKAELKGPIGMTDMITTQMRAGWVRGLEILAALSVYLGLFNLLPLPALDGGRLAFLGYELATRRRPNAKVETAVHMAGMLVLLVVLFVVSYKEIGQLISKAAS